MSAWSADRSRLGIHVFLPSIQVVPYDLQAHLNRVLECASRNLEVNVDIVLDADGRCDTGGEGCHHLGCPRGETPAGGSAALVHNARMTARLGDRFFTVNLHG